MSSDSASGDWQSSKNNLKERFSFIFDNNLHSDIHFIVGTEERRKIPACKMVLSAGSSVFHTMFTENWSKSDEDIEVPDIEAAIFQELIRFLYTDQIAITVDTAAPLMYASRKYGISAVENSCTDFLVKNLQVNNVYRLLTQAKLYSVQKLVDVCLDLMDNNTSAVIQAEDFCNIDVETLCLILKRDTLNIREIELFKAVLRWSEAKCRRGILPVNSENRKAVLKQAIPLIRYPLMSTAEFASTVPDSGLLAEKEQLDMFIYFNKEVKPSTKYNSTPRKGSHEVVNTAPKI